MASGSVEDRSATLIGIVVMLLVIATLVVVLRLWTRYFILNQLGADDYLALVSLVRQAFLEAPLGQQLTRRTNRTRYGLGKHVSAINPETVPLYFKHFYVSVVLYTASLMFIKLTFLAHYYRLLAIQEMKRVYKAAIVIVGGWALSQVLVGIFICWPVQGFWDKTVDARCIPNQPQWYINAAGNIVTDIMVFLLPIPAIRSLRLPRTQKFILAGIFSLGFFTVILSAIRIEYLQEFEDFSWKHVESNLWSLAELTSALICASLPTLRPFVTRYLPALASKLARSTGRYGRGHGSRIHSSSGAYNLGRDNKSSKSVGRGVDQLFHDNGATFEMQHQYSSEEIGYSRHRSDEDLVGGWEAGGIKTGAVASVRDVPSRGIRAETNRV
ncbi:hypothetical protein FDECE_1439 [Fusarium decemcellulare]|nr:hypothetical protein FDECE_1439 [Fusarium decemcellulare]